MKKHTHESVATPERGSFSINFSEAYLKEHISLPKDKDGIPQILGWSGPARCGSTGLLFLLASQPEVDHAYFQPQKSILRRGKPDFILHSKDKLVCMKEVFRSAFHDPVATLLEKGVPANKITWIAILRDPLQNYASWLSYFPETTPQLFAETQRHTLEFFHQYHRAGVKMIPFSYELLKQKGEERVINALIAQTGVPINRHVTTGFKPDEIMPKLVKGQFWDFYDTYLSKILQHNKFEYISREGELPEAIAKEVNKLCQKEYEEFHRLSKKELGL